MKLKDTLFNDAQRDEFIIPSMKEDNIPGLCMTAIKDFKIAGTWAYGRKDEEGGLVSEDTVFETASLTKPLFATLVLQLAETGLIDLNTPFAPLIPELSITDNPLVNKITPLIVLSHSTGFPNWKDKPLSFSFSPGEGFGYSGEGFFYLQRYIEKITDKKLPELFLDHFFIPWHMPNSSGIWHDGLSMSNGYDSDGKVNKIRDSVDLAGNGPEPNAAWSLYSTTKEYAIFIEKLLTGDAGLSQESLINMMTPHNQWNEHILWGLGVGLVKEAPNLFWHWGNNSGFKSFVVADRETGDGLIIFTNSDNGNAYTLKLAEHFTDVDFFDEILSFINRAE